MSFEEFLATYDIVDFAWEIFKGISPTVIALLTIWINTIIGKRKSEKESYSREIKELQSMVANLSPYILETGEYLLESIQNANKKQKSNEMFDIFYSKNKDMLREARKFLAYANIRAEILNNERIVFTDTCSTITDYSYELLDTLKWYNQMAPVTPIVGFGDLCDEVQRKMIDATSKVEEALKKYCIELIK